MMGTGVHGPLPGPEPPSRPVMYSETDEYRLKTDILREFYRKCTKLLSKENRSYLLGVLKEYQMYHQIEKLVNCLHAVLNTPTKLDLLKEIRHFIASSQLNEYDRLVPYHKMAHPWKYSNQGTMPRPGPQRVHILKSTHGALKYKTDVVNGSTELQKGPPAPLKVLNLVRDNDDALGFSIRGGSEHGLGIYVSDVELASAADDAGVEVGDNIVEVNNINFTNIASSSAAKLLTGSRHLKIIVRRLHKIPGFKSGRERTSWYDVTQNTILEGSMQQHGTLHTPDVLGAKNKVINLPDDEYEHNALGFNIRGGIEYGLGIYVSRIDDGCLAEKRHLRLGDQLLRVNGHSLQNVTHSQAVDIIQSQKHLQLTVLGVGKYPAFKEIFAEYEWTDTHSGTFSKTRTGTHVTRSRVLSSHHLPSYSTSVSTETRQFTEYPEDSRVQTYVQTDDESDEGLAVDVPITHPVDIGVQTDSDSEPSPSLLPKSSDIEMRPAMSQQPEQQLNQNKAHKHSVHKKDLELSRPMLAVRAMELETRANYPELALDLQTKDQKIPAKDDAELNSDVRSRTLKDVFLFGSKSKGSRITTSNPVPKTSADSHFIVKQSNMLSSTVQDLQQNVQQVLTNHDEVKAVVRHITKYEKEKKLSNLLEPLLAILDSHQKIQLLRDIRCIITPADQPEYDRIVVNQEQMYLRRRTLKELSSNLNPKSNTKHMLSSTEHIPQQTSQQGYSKPFGLIEGQPDIEERVPPSVPDAKYNYEIHRLHSNSRVYKALSDDIRQITDKLQNSTAHDTKKTNKDQIHEKNVKIKRYSGPFLEEDDTKSQHHNHYFDIEELSKVQSKGKSTFSNVEGTNTSKALHMSDNSITKSATVTQNADSPLYAEVNKNKKKHTEETAKHSFASVHNQTSFMSKQSSINSGNKHVPKEKGSAFKMGKDDLVAYREVKAALGFLDELEDGCDSTDDSVWPQSEVSSLAESHYGSYDVTLPEPTGRSPPRFIAPPPPDDSPPNSTVSSELQDTVTDVSFTQRQTSLDFATREKFIPMDVYTMPSHQKAEPNNQQSRVVVLSKNHKSLGFSISGGSDSRTQPEIHIKDVLPGGAAATPVRGSLECGMLLVAIDGNSLIEATHSQAVRLICKIFNNKQQPTMELAVKELK